MDVEEFKASLRNLKAQFAATPGLEWRRPIIQPRHASGKLFGWNSTVVITFESSTDFIRLKENWRLSRETFSRQFFSYHFGPYENHWTLETVECQAVIVRVDADNKGGRGYHLHDGAKNNRVHQDQMEVPDLSTLKMDEFITGVLAMRYGKSLQDAFGIKMK